MDFTVIFMVSTMLALLCSPSTHAQTAAPPSLAPTPAPAPAPGFVNLTDLLSVAGPFHTFLSYLESTKTIETFQNQANNTEEGITLFVPKDDAFSSLKKSTLSNLTQDQLKSICLFHALSHYYSLSDFKNLSETSPISTFAGGQYSLNFTDVSGTVHIGSGWPNTKVSSSVYSPDPIAIYQVDKVLLPEAIFGTDIPPTPAPAPAPDIDPAARIVPTVHTNSFRLTIIQPRSTYFFFFCSPGPNNQLCCVSSSGLDSAALSNSCRFLLRSSSVAESAAFISSGPPHGSLPYISSSSSSNYYEICEMPGL